MNQDTKYDAYLLDIISLFQEAIIRALSNRTIDINKFNHYFSTIFDKMTSIQQKFHAQSKKISKHLVKLKIFLSKEAESSKRKEHCSSQRYDNDGDQPIEQPIINFKPSHKQVYGSRELKSIEQQNEGHQPFINSSKRRSETANGYRQKVFENTRPMTGQMGKNKYKNKTIQMPSNPLTEEPQSYSKTIHNQQYQKDYRKDFYTQLQKIKDQQQKGRQLVPYNLPFRKKSLSQKKWTHKIGRFL